MRTNRSYQWRALSMLGHGLAVAGVVLVITACFAPLNAERPARVAIVLPPLGTLDLQPNELEIKVFFYRASDASLVEIEPGIWDLSVKSGAQSVPISGRPYFLITENDHNSGFGFNDFNVTRRTASIEVPVGGPYVVYAEVNALTGGGFPYNERFFVSVDGFPDPPQVFTFSVRSGETIRLEEFRTLPVNTT